jgi:hypothetical protein
VEIEESVRSRELSGPLLWAANGALILLPLAGVFFSLKRAPDARLAHI